MSAAVVVLSGSTRFREEFEEVAEKLTMAGMIVLMPHVWERSWTSGGLSEEEKFALDELHLQKIDLANRMVVVDPSGYIGASTTKEIEYATRRGIPVAYTHAERTRDEPNLSDLYE